jgi:COMPASS component SDC1
VSAVASPAPARTGTPVRTNGVHDKEPGSSRANSVLPEQREPLPDRAAAHGEPARKYLNTKVAEHLLAGMKKLAKEQ